jgi:hypothetical protein
LPETGKVLWLSIARVEIAERLCNVIYNLRRLRASSEGLSSGQTFDRGK